jgi:hypothetical protein
MKVRAVTVMYGNEIEGWLYEKDGEAFIFSLDKFSKVDLWKFYKGSLEFWIQGSWRNLTEGMGLLIGLYGKECVPQSLLRYYNEKVREEAQGVQRPES